MKNIEKSVVHMLAVAAAECPDRLAVRCASAALSYGQYFNCVASLAARLREAGVAPGDRVVTIMANSADAAVANFGIQASGAQLVPLNPAYTSAELDIIIADASPTVVLCDVEIAATLEKAGAGCEMRITVSPGDLLLDRDNASERDEIVLPEPEWLSTLQYTGGTQGLPKGVNLTHRSVVSNIAQREALVPTVDGERVMCITPLFHVYAVSMGLYLAAHCRGTLHIVRKFDAGEIFRDIACHRISFLSASPTILLGFMKHQDFADADFSSLRIISPVQESGHAVGQLVTHRPRSGVVEAEALGQAFNGFRHVFDALRRQARWVEPISFAVYLTLKVAPEISMGLDSICRLQNRALGHIEIGHGPF